MKKSYEFEADVDFHRAIEQLLHLAQAAGRVGTSGYLAVYVDGDGLTRPKLSSVSPVMQTVAAQAIGANQSPFGAGYGIALAHSRGCTVSPGQLGDVGLSVRRVERIEISGPNRELKVVGVEE